MDAIILNAASENVTRMMKKVTGRMGIDKSSGQIIDATAKKDKDKAVKALTRNLAKCSHSNTIMAADFLIYHVSCSCSRMFTFSFTVPVLAEPSPLKYCVVSKLWRFGACIL